MAELDTHKEYEMERRYNSLHTQYPPFPLE